jgi:hypothetical protein
MKKILLAVVFLAFVLVLPEKALSQFSYPQGSLPTTITASVGQFYVNISGFASPFASIVLSSNGVLLRSTVADSSGRFFLSQVLVRDGKNKFCFTVVDFRHLGESQSCLEADIDKTPYSLSNILLPPTIAVSKKEVKTGETVYVFGYTMPNSKVTIRINKTQTITVQSDGLGYYTYKFEKLPVGTYALFASAKYKDKDSLEPLAGVTLKAVSLPAFVGRTLLDILRQIWKFLTTSLALFVILVFVLLLFIFFIWRRLRSKKMHHDWFLKEKPVGRGFGLFEKTLFRRF